MAKSNQKKRLSSEKVLYLKLGVGNFKIYHGFTLIELLVVITILAILVGFMIATINFVTGRARDARRKADLTSVKKALAMAKLDSQTGTLLPQCNTSIGDGCYITDSQNTIPSLVPAYIRSLPLNPKTNSAYHYYPKPSGPSQCNNNSSNPCTSFQLIACIENGNDPSAIPDSSECPQTGFKYIVTND